MYWLAWYSFILLTGGLLLNIVDKKSSGRQKLLTLIMSLPIILFLAKYLELL